MSQIANCPTCGSKSKVKEINGEMTYQAVQNEEALMKIGQLKKTMQKFKEKSEKLEKELVLLKSKQ